MKTKIIMIILLLMSSMIKAQTIGVSQISLNPQSLFHVHSTAAGQLFQLSNVNTTGGNSPTSTSGFNISIDVSKNINFNQMEVAGISFATSNATRVAIDASGYIGINTAPSASYRLNVAGNVNLTGAIYANGSAGTNGQLLYSTAGATDAWLPVGTSGQLFVATGAVPGWQNVSTALNNTAWLTTRNTGLSDGTTNLLGTTDAVPIRFVTSNAERMQINAAGYVGIFTNPSASYRLYVNNSSTTLGDAAINGTISGNGQVYGVYGTTNSTTANGSGVYGYASGTTVANNGVWGQSASNAGSGVYGLGSIGVFGITNFTGGLAVAGNGLTNGYAGYFTSQTSAYLGTLYSENSTTDGTAVYAKNTTATGAGNFGDAIEAFTAQSGSAALWGENTSTIGTGIMASGNNIGTNFLAAGSGGAFTGTTYGAYLRANNTSGQRAALCAVAYTAGGVQRQTLVGAFSATNVEYKIWGTGGATVSTSVPDLNGQSATLHAVETPEYYFSDYGQAQLNNGKVHVDIDPILVKNIAINDKHPLRVFVQLEGDCNGVYITNKTKNGFDVVELNGGKSNVKFQWNIVCNVADMDGSNYSELRFEVGPIIEKSETKKELTKEKKGKTVEIIKK
jgi:hypothetical protein